MNNPIITGVLAYGMSGKVFHTPFVDTHTGFDFYAVTERNMKTAHERFPNIKSFTSVDELISDEKIELVIVNTPNNTHYEYAKKALLAGKHILVEKPFATTVKEAEELFEIADKNNLKVLFYHNRRWDSDYLSIKQVLESRKLGKLIEVHLRFDRYRSDIGPKVFKETPIAGSGVSYDLGSHLLDQAISLFGEPLWFSKTLGCYREKSLVDDYLFIHLKFQENLNVYLTASLLVAQPLPAYVLHGTKGTYMKDRTDIQEMQLLQEVSPLDPGYGIEEQGAEGTLTVMKSDAEREIIRIPNQKSDYSNLFTAVYNSIRYQATYPVKREEILWQLKILQEGK